MNKIVDTLNTKAKAVCDSFDLCVFVDANDAIDRLQGHFCQPGVDESYSPLSGGVSQNREGTWFYEWGTTKDDDTDAEKKVDQPQRRATTAREYPNSTFEGAVSNLISLSIRANTMEPSVTGKLPALAEDFTTYSSLWRIFHHTKWANGVLARRVNEAMNIEQAKILGQSYVKPSIVYPKRDAIPTATPSPKATLLYSPSGNGASDDPAVKDKCHVHVWEYWNCGAQSKNLQASIQLWDAAGKQMLSKGNPISINDGDPRKWRSKLEKELLLTGEHTNDYIQFSLGPLNWRSTDYDKKTDAWCNKPGGWDPKGGPACGVPTSPSVS
ncbi:hypothetical protein EJ08DRAFT_694339 [Tothia fuscella]|uniref:Uncharacterized protein n=1 Tax=Tothia fuscella TaxID=1048955 RepID=A0A9P4NY27_9PEZI|nr:hypothetical protein EJ08DRAFT_694339 [Tothia fuscella]